MKKAILSIVLLLALVWCLSEPIDGKLGWGWVLGEAVGFVVVYFCGRKLRKYYPEK